ncbi:MAG TPA: Gfo/Idh/MocA family oxidoreductase [Pseudonocardiaceae bacterium]
MPNRKRLGVGVVGCGNIAAAYTTDLAGYPDVDFRGVTDLDPTRAAALAQAHDVQAYPDLDAMLDDPAVDIVVNLTTHHAHHAVVRRCLEADRHVYSEKPLSLEYAEARELVELAERRGLRLACAPATFLGEAQQTAMRHVREGGIGRVRVVYAEVNWGRIESWHPEPAAFYDVGPLFDVGVYPLTVATALLGPARRVTAFGTVVHPRRTTVDGAPFTVTTPDFVVAVVELASGCLVRLTANFYVGRHSVQRGMEFHGDEGSLYLSDWHDFDGTVETAPFGGPYRSLPLARAATRNMERGRAVLDLVEAIREERPHRADGRQAAHVVEILCAARESYLTHQPVQVCSDFVPPEPMEWAR